MLARSYLHSGSDQRTPERVHFVAIRRAVCSELSVKVIALKFGLLRCGRRVRGEVGVGGCGGFEKSNFGCGDQQEER